VVKSGAEDASSRTKPANRYSIRLTICVNRVWCSAFGVTTTKDIVLVLEFGRGLFVIEAVSPKSAVCKAAGPACLPRSVPGSAMLPHILDEANAGSRNAGGRLRFGASPYQCCRGRRRRRRRRGRLRANAERRTPNAKRQTLPQSFDLLQHSFGDFANLAWGQE
jgi:hypothetical protein